MKNWNVKSVSSAPGVSCIHIPSGFYKYISIYRTCIRRIRATKYERGELSWQRKLCELWMDIRTWRKHQISVVVKQRSRNQYHLSRRTHSRSNRYKTVLQGILSNPESRTVLVIWYLTNFPSQHLRPSWLKFPILLFVHPNKCIFLTRRVLSIRARVSRKGSKIKRSLVCINLVYGLCGAIRAACNIKRKIFREVDHFFYNPLRYFWWLATLYYHLKMISLNFFRFWS